MEKLRPSPEWEVLLQPFESCFTKPDYRLFRAFVLTLTHLEGRLWVTQVVLTSPLSCHWTCFHRFLSRAVWSVEAVRQGLFRLCLSRCVGPDGRLLVGIDDTVCAKSGRHFEGAGSHHDPMNRAHPKRLSWGHCWVCLALLAPYVPPHYVALFLGCALYGQQQRCQEERLFATKLELAVQLLKTLPIMLGVWVIAVADGAYARRAFVQGVHLGHQVISRLRSDTVFYALPPVRPKQANGKYARGRPRQYGKKHKAREWAEQATGWREVVMTLYGQSVSLHLKTRVVIQRTLGVRIRLVAVRWGARPVVFLFSTDVAMRAEARVQTYCARFALETGFRDAKQSFGFTTYQVRKEWGVVRLAHLCLWAQTLLRLRCWEEKPEPIDGAWRKALGYLTLSQQNCRGVVVEFWRVLGDPPQPLKNRVAWRLLREEDREEEPKWLNYR